MDILEKIVNQIKTEEMQAFERFDLKKAEKDPRVPLPFPSEKDFERICEIKKGSPSKGIIRENFEPVQMAKAYSKSGATAISVITEKNFFFGKPEDLQSVREKTTLPLLRKDFTIHEAQIAMAKLWGADIILLIVACLNDKRLQALHSYALSLGLCPLVEIHNQKELERAMLIPGLKLLGINNRDLKSFKVSLNTSFELKKLIPDNISVISESGIITHDDYLALKDAGFRGVLVGESLLKQEDLSLAVRKLIHGSD